MHSRGCQSTFVCWRRGGAVPGVLWYQHSLSQVTHAIAEEERGDRKYTWCFGLRPVHTISGYAVFISSFQRFTTTLSLTPSFPNFVHYTDDWIKYCSLSFFVRLFLITLYLPSIFHCAVSWFQMTYHSTGIYQVLNIYSPLAVDRTIFFITYLKKKKMLSFMMIQYDIVVWYCVLF